MTEIYLLLIFTHALVLTDSLIEIWALLVWPKYEKPETVSSCSRYQYLRSRDRRFLALKT